MFQNVLTYNYIVSLGGPIVSNIEKKEVFDLEYILLGILVLFICILIYQKNNYSKRISLYEEEQVKLNGKCSKYLKENKELNEKCSMYIRDIEGLKEMLNKQEKEEYEKKDGYETVEGKIKEESIYKGKKALIGDYMLSSFCNTEKVLKSLGFSVDIVKKKEDVINKVKYQNDYDIILSNNVYPDGSGPECLKELKKIENFSTPVVIHTITENARDYFINRIGFDEYIVKPLTQKKVKSVLEKILIK